MIRKGTVSHEILMTIVDNPMELKQLCGEVGKISRDLLPHIKYMTKQQGVKIQRDDKKLWIDSEDLPEFNTYGYEKVYIHMLECGEVTNTEIRSICGNNSNSLEIIDKIKSGFGVEIEMLTFKARNGQQSRKWRIA